MDWVNLSIIHTILVALKILYIKYDNTPFFVFPIIINIIVGIFSLIYFILYYKETFTNEFVKPKYYIFSFIGLVITLLGFYIIKVCPNPAYFRVFVSLQIILLLLATMYINKNYNISIQKMIGILCGCAAIILISLDENNK
jgi:drug/metabolite transporter (DMT)-like permease